MVFWPLGLAMLAYILWGDRLDAFKADVNPRHRWTGVLVPQDAGRHAHETAAATRRLTHGATRNLRGSMKSARSSTRCAANFDQHMRDLRMARDRAEFDQFMAAREAKTRKSGSVPEIDG